MSQTPAAKAARHRRRMQKQKIQTLAANEPHRTEFIKLALAHARSNHTDTTTACFEIGQRLYDLVRMLKS